MDLFGFEKSIWANYTYCFIYYRLFDNDQNCVYKYVFSTVNIFTFIFESM
jgi:hypothetical protein